MEISMHAQFMCPWAALAACFSAAGRKCNRFPRHDDAMSPYIAPDITS